MTPERKARLDLTASRRQPDITVVLENVHDPHNVAAVLRSCESVGMSEIYVLYTEAHLIKRGLKIGKRTSGGARKWVDVHLYRDLDACLKKVKEKYSTLYATHLGKASQSLYEVDFTGPCAILLGNEAKGISEEAMQHVSGNIHIPQMGMVRSLNISVSAGVLLYEILRQRQEAGMYAEHSRISPEYRENVRRNLYLRHEEGTKGDWALESNWVE